MDPEQHRAVPGAAAAVADAAIGQFLRMRAAYGEGIGRAVAALEATIGGRKAYGYDSIVRNYQHQLQEWQHGARVSEETALEVYHDAVDRTRAFALGLPRELSDDEREVLLDQFEEWLVWCELLGQGLRELGYRLGDAEPEDEA